MLSWSRPQATAPRAATSAAVRPIPTTTRPPIPQRPSRSAATDHYDNWASYSGYKPYIDLAAPGGVSEDQIMSTVPGGYGFEYGTSMATPLVSAAAALVMTYMPAATNTEVADILKNTADKVGPYSYSGGRNDWYGAGRSTWRAPCAGPTRPRLS